MIEGAVEQIIKNSISERGVGVVKLLMTDPKFNPLEFAHDVSELGNVQLTFDALSLISTDDVTKASILSSAFFHAFMAQKGRTRIYARFDLPGVQLKSLRKETIFKDGAKNFRDLAIILAQKIPHVAGSLD